MLADAHPQLLAPTASRQRSRAEDSRLTAETFAGGAIPLSPALAEESVAVTVAGPLNVTTAEAAPEWSGTLYEAAARAGMEADAPADGHKAEPRKEPEQAESFDFLGGDAARPTASLRKRAASILDGAETIRRDGRAACFED